MTKNKSKRIYLSPPHMCGLELKFIKKAFESNWISSLGPYVDEFEIKLANYVGVKYAAAVSSGTAALHLALRILGIGKGDTVLCSSFTFAASATPIVFQGAKPVFIDSDKTSWNIDTNLLENFLKKSAGRNKLPKALIAVHLYGQSSDLDPIMKICKRYNIPVIEDAAESLGALYKSQKTGSFGDLSVFSFNGNKIITTSGGGMLVSDNEEYIKTARFLSTQARDPYPYYHHTQIGYNYRLSNVLAAIGVGQLSVIDDRIKRKREIFDLYKKQLSGQAGISFMPEPEWSKANRWLTLIIIDSNLFGATNEEIRLELERHNIESRPLWKPLHMQPVFSKCTVVGGDVSRSLFETGLCLPSGTTLQDKDIVKICDIIKG